MIEQFLLASSQKADGLVAFDFQVQSVVAAWELNGASDDLLEALGLCGVGSKLIDYFMNHFGPLIDEIGLDEFRKRFSCADDKAILVDFEILANIRWKFHFKLSDYIITQVIRILFYLLNKEFIYIRYV